MNQVNASRGRRAPVPSNIYTAFLAVSCLVLTGTVLFVALSWIFTYQPLQ